MVNNIDELLPAEQDSESSSADEASEVGTLDVDDKSILFGRGKACNNNRANQRMRTVISSFKDRYHAAGRGGKKLIVRQVHRQLVEEGMKFLKQEDGIDGWIEADAEEAITKVGHAIRCNRNRGTRIKSDGDFDDPPSGPSAVAPSLPAEAGRVPEDILPGDSRGDVAASLALASLPNVASAGLLPSSLLAGRQPILGSTLPLGSSLLLFPLGSIPSQLTGLLYPPLSASLGLAAQVPPLAPSTALSGLSELEIYILMKRERQLQQAMLYDQIMGNNNRDQQL